MPSTVGASLDDARACAETSASLAGRPNSTIENQGTTPLPPVGGPSHRIFYPKSILLNQGMISRSILLVCLLALSACNARDESRFFANLLGHTKEEVIRAFGHPKKVEARTGGLESLVWKGQTFSVQSTFKDGKAMRFAYMLAASGDQAAIAARIRASFADSLTWREEKTDVFGQVRSVQLRSDLKVTILDDKDVVYVFGEEIW